jgi:hypothetical protein
MRSSKPEHHVSLALTCTLTLSTLRIANRARSRKEQHLNRNCKPGVQCENHNQQDLARILLRRIQDRIQIAQEEEGRERQSQGDEDVIENYNKNMSALLSPIILHQ